MVPVGNAGRRTHIEMVASALKFVATAAVDATEVADGNESADAL